MKIDEIRRESGINYIKWFVVAIIWNTAFIILIPVCLSIAPDVEGYLWPALKDQEFSEKHLKEDDSEFLLFKWTFFKNRRATPQFISFMAYPPENPNERIPVEVFTNWECNRNFQSDRSNPANTMTERDICVRLPAKWTGRRDIMIEGFAEYRVGHGLYTIPQKIPGR